jgi:serine protease inhibitor
VFTDPQSYFHSFAANIAGNPGIRVANSVFVEKSEVVQDQFAEIVRKNYFGDVRNVPFVETPDEARKMVGNKKEGERGRREKRGRNDLSLSNPI